MAGSPPIIGENVSTSPPIGGVPAAVTAFIDYFSAGPTNTPTSIESFLDFEQTFGGLDPLSEASYQVQQFFNAGGHSAIVLRLAAAPSSSLFASALESALTGFSAPFNLLCIPATANLVPADMHAVMQAAQMLCAAKSAFYIADIPPSNVVSSSPAIAAWFAGSGLSGIDRAAIYYPRLKVADPVQQNAPREIGYSGAVAGICARTDDTRGVWNAPAGLSATIPGATPVVAIDDVATGQLTSLAINSIRSFPGSGTVLWGARTAAGGGSSISDFRYINVRRLAIYIEQSIFSGLQWVIFEPNNPTLWASIRLAVNSFLCGLWRQGGLQGSKSQDGFFVQCDATTTSQADIDGGRVNIQIGFAPVRPAEFILITISLLAGSDPCGN